MKLLVMDGRGEVTVIDLGTGPAVLYCQAWGDWRIRVRQDADVECFQNGYEEQGTRVAIIGGHDA